MDIRIYLPDIGIFHSNDLRFMSTNANNCFVIYVNGVSTINVKPLLSLVYQKVSDC